MKDIEFLCSRNEIESGKIPFKKGNAVSHKLLGLRVYFYCSGRNVQ